MPTPIEHLLIPQIQKKQSELAAALPSPSYLDGYGSDLPGVDLNAPGVAQPDVPNVEPYVWHDPTVAPAPPAAPPIGYLGAPQQHMWMDMPATKEQMRGKAYLAPPSELDQKNTPLMAEYARAIGQIPNEPGYLQFKNGAVGGSVGAADAAAMRAAERVAPPEAIVAPTKDKRGNVVIRVTPGEPIGTTERGQYVDGAGRNLGYLREDLGAMRTLERGRSDVKIAAPPKGETSTPDTDAFGRKVFDDVYRPYLKALDENDGQWPDDMFKGTTKKERDAIHEGVQELRRRDKGEKT